MDNKNLKELTMKNLDNDNGTWTVDLFMKRINELSKEYLSSCSMNTSSNSELLENVKIENDMVMNKMSEKSMTPSLPVLEEFLNSINNEIENIVDTQISLIELLYKFKFNMEGPIFNVFSDGMIYEEKFKIVVDNMHSLRNILYSIDENLKQVI